MTVKNAVEILLDEVLDGGRCSSKQGDAIRTVVHALGFYRPKDCKGEEYAPVRHGRWNADETCPYCGKKSTEGMDAEKWDYWFPEFCPHCGAIMDLQ